MVDPEDKEILRQLAKLGALSDYIYTSSGEIGRRIGVSQQTASRRILDLVDRGFLTRRMTPRKQFIRLAAPGVEVLRKDLVELKALFATAEHMTIRGRVVAGLGEGQYYISRPGYMKAFNEILGFEPFPGTLNVEVEPLDREKVAELKEREGRLIKEFVSEGRTFGAVKCFRADLGGVECAAIFPLRSHHTNVLEMISPVQLRKKLDLADGADVSVRILLD
ncbi:MAG TPA: DUF120 domain-containing protein [Candidatus Thermoplasmatota archaeon]|nr:DUF120 domain-containing protein [Candidatus Thermoplasmatota archaeon]